MIGDNDEIEKSDNYTHEEVELMLGRMRYMFFNELEKEKTQVEGGAKELEYKAIKDKDDIESDTEARKLVRVVENIDRLDLYMRNRIGVSPDNYLTD